MKKLPSTILTGAAFALLLVGCGQQDDQDPMTSDSGSSIMNEDRTSQAPARDPSLPAGDIYNEQDSTGTTGTGSTGAGSTGMDSGDTGSTGIDSTSPGSTGAGSTGAGTTGTGTTGTGTSGAGTTGSDTAGTGTTMDEDGRISGGQDSADRDQTSPETLSQDEERNEMPLPGQNSDHSTPNPDQTSSR